MSRERRQAPRVTEQVPVAITEAGTELRTETKNLSGLGVYCTVNRFIAPMTKLALRLELPNQRHPVMVQCTGVVVRAEPAVAHAERGVYHVAIFFTEMTDQDRAAIAQFVGRHP